MQDPTDRQDLHDSPEVLARIQEGLELVEAIAGQMKRRVSRNVSRDDLVSFGREGLLSAARSFDPSRGVPFRSWASLRVRGSMIDGLRSMGGLPRGLHRELRAMEASGLYQEAAVEENASSPPPDAKAADERLSSYLAGMATAMTVGLLSTSASGMVEDVQDRGASAEDKLAFQQLAVHMREALARLPDSERKLLEAHYYGGMTIDEAAKQIGLSKSWGSRLHARAIEMLAKDFKRGKVGI